MERKGSNLLPEQSQRILISNDDGINAPGIRVLVEVARQFSDDVWIVAPEINNSGAGHSLTLNRPLRTRHLDDRTFAVDGTPTDCVMIAVHHLLKDRAPDLVLSGVNYGANVAEDVTYSGTVAAAMEATLLNIKSIAFSQVCESRDLVRWQTASTWAPKVIRETVEMTWPAGVLLNVNFPDCPAGDVTGVQVCTQGTRAPGDNVVERIDPRGEPYIWVGALRGDDRDVAGTDLAAINERAVAVTPIHLDMTHYQSLVAFQEKLQG